MVLVSICCLTYNHRPYIKNCLDGFLFQKCNFKFEVLIHDDASTDGTSDIIREFQDKHPDIIKPIIQTENQYSKGVAVNSVYNFSRAQGKYIALCEGDDYWTDPFKLQKQFDILETNNHLSLCVGNFTILENGVERKINKCDSELKCFEFGLEDTLNVWLTKTLTSFIRTKYLADYNPYLFRYARDIHLFHHLLLRGKGFFLCDNLGTYRVHNGGVHTSNIGTNNINMAYNCYNEIYIFYKDDISRLKALKSSAEKISNDLYSRDSFSTIYDKIKLIFFTVSLVRHIKEIKFIIFAFIPRNLKNIIKANNFIKFKKILMSN